MENNFSGKDLIFILSQPRAGSTLLQLMLAGHPDIATFSEPWVALHPLYELKAAGLNSEFDSGLAREALLHFLKKGGITLEDYNAGIAGRLLDLYGKHARMQGRKFFLDKTPRYYFIADELLDVFPEAKFIVLFRNPLAVLNSILDTWVKGDICRLSDFRHDLMVAPRKLLEFSRAHPGKCFVQGYEELTGEPEGSVRRLCAYLGIEYDNGMLRYDREKTAGWPFGDDVGVLKSDRPTEAPFSKWVSGLSDPDRKYLFASYLVGLGAETVTGIGYDYDSLIGMTGLPEKRPGNPWQVLTRDNSSLYNSIELAYLMALNERSQMRYVYSAALFGLEYYQAGSARGKGGLDFWAKYSAEYAWRFCRKLLGIGGRPA